MIATICNKCGKCNATSTAINGGVYTNDFSTLTFSPPNQTAADYPNTWLWYNGSRSDIFALPPDQKPYTPGTWPAHVDETTNRLAIRQGAISRLRKGYEQGTEFVSITGTIAWDEELNNPATPLFVGIGITANGLYYATGSIYMILNMSLRDVIYCSIGRPQNRIYAPWIFKQPARWKIELEKVSEQAGNSNQYVYQSTARFFIDDVLLHSGPFEHTGLINGDTDINNSACAFETGVFATAGNNGGISFFYLDDLELVAQ